MPDKSQPPALTDFNRLVLDLEIKPDRDLCIMGCSFLDLALRQAIKVRLVDLPKRREAELFEGPTSALGSFSNKIKIAHALGLIDERTRTECDRIRSVRNKFAHSFYDVHCDTQDITDEIQKLKDPTRTMDEWHSADPTAARTFQTEVECTDRLHRSTGKPIDVSDIAAAVDPNGHLLFYVPTMASSPSSPRDKLLYALWMNIFIVTSQSIQSWAKQFGV